MARCVVIYARSGIIGLESPYSLFPGCPPQRKTVTPNHLLARSPPPPPPPPPPPHTHTHTTNFVPTCKSKLELQSTNAKIGTKFALTSVTPNIELWPSRSAWTSFLWMLITPENLWRYDGRSILKRVSQIDRRTDEQTKRCVLRAAWSQLKIICPVFQTGV